MKIRYHWEHECQSESSDSRKLTKRLHVQSLRGVNVLNTFQCTYQNLLCSYGSFLITVALTKHYAKQNDHTRVWIISVGTANSYSKLFLSLTLNERLLKRLTV